LLDEPVRTTSNRRGERTPFVASRSMEPAGFGWHSSVEVGYPHPRSLHSPGLSRGERRLPVPLTGGCPLGRARIRDLRLHWASPATSKCLKEVGTGRVNRMHLDKGYDCDAVRDVRVFWPHCASRCDLAP